MTVQAQAATISASPAVDDSNGFAISQWHDTDEVMAKLNALLSQPVRPKAIVKWCHLDRD